MLSEPLPYHWKIRDYFKAQSGIWSFFSADRKKEEQLASFKSDLLKNTYQFQPGSDPLLYEKIKSIQERLGLAPLRVTAYQAAHSSELNASIVCLPGEAHMVFSGAILQLLDEHELSALIAHELAHIKFYSLSNGELETTDRIISVLAGSPDSGASHYETARLFRLYKEIYCDREAYGVLGGAGPVITMLLKIATGLPVVHAESYIQQAEEIFSGDAGVQSASLTHPENFIRTRALHLWQSSQAGDPGVEEAIAQMIEGVMELDRLDVLSQRELMEQTRALLITYLQPEWFRTPVVVALARQYFADLEVGKEAGQLPDLTDAHPSIREYFAYVLLDLALADPDLEDVPLGHALALAETLGLTSVLESIVKKELTYSDKQWERVKAAIPRQEPGIAGSGSTKL
ncbi:MAG TPA: M48 family metalloprotease [Puia sp.]|nr:M48 family metalloprotease [Puia sp.]